MHFMGERVLGLGIALQDDAQQTFTADDVVDEFSALGGFDEERGDHARENDDIREAQDR